MNPMRKNVAYPMTYFVTSWIRLKTIHLNKQVLAVLKRRRGILANLPAMANNPQAIQGNPLEARLKLAEMQRLTHLLPVLQAEMQRQALLAPEQRPTKRWGFLQVRKVLRALVVVLPAVELQLVAPLPVALLPVVLLPAVLQLVAPLPVVLLPVVLLLGLALLRQLRLSESDVWLFWL